MANTLKITNVSQTFLLIVWQTSCNRTGLNHQGCGQNVKYVFQTEAQDLGEDDHAASATDFSFFNQIYL